MTQFLYENDLVGINYAEPYAGGAGLALRLLMDEYVSEVYLNDLNPSIYSFWWAVLNQSDELMGWLKNIDITIDNWQYYKQIQREYKTADLLELAKSTFFLNRTNVSGVLSGGVIGGINQMGKYKIDARFNKEELIRRIEEISCFAERIHLSNLDGVEFVKAMEKRAESMLIYLDPPYYKKGADLYLNAFKDDDHRILAKCVKKIKKYWMVSYDNQDFIMNLYPEYRKVLYQLSQCASNRVGDEVLIFDNRLSYDVSVKLLTNPQQI